MAPTHINPTDDDDEEDDELDCVSDSADSDSDSDSDSDCDSNADSDSPFNSFDMQPALTSTARREGDGGGDMCIVCTEKKADACLLQCGHMYTCTVCASKLSSCPLCRQHIKQVIRVYAQQM